MPMPSVAAPHVDQLAKLGEVIGGGERPGCPRRKLSHGPVENLSGCGVLRQVLIGPQAKGLVEGSLPGLHTMQQVPPRAPVLRCPEKDRQGPERAGPFSL